MGFGENCIAPLSGLNSLACLILVFCLVRLPGLCFLRDRPLIWSTVAASKLKITPFLNSALTGPLFSCCPHRTVGASCRRCERSRLSASTLRLPSAGAATCTTATSTTTSKCVPCDELSLLRDRLTSSLSLLPFAPCEGTFAISFTSSFACLFHCFTAHATSAYTTAVQYYSARELQIALALLLFFCLVMSQVAFMDPVLRKMLWYHCPAGGGKILIPKCVPLSSVPLWR